MKAIGVVDHDRSYRVVDDHLELQPRHFNNPDARYEKPLIFAPWMIDLVGYGVITKWCKANRYSWVELLP